MHLSHVTVEIPVSYLDKAAYWYENYLGLTQVENPTPEGHMGHDAVWFAEGVHLLGVKHWESHSQSFAHFAVVLGDLFDKAQRLTARQHQEGVNDDRFFIQDPWSNRIECVRE